jgi:hypothetical protein
VFVPRSSELRFKGIALGLGLSFLGSETTPSRFARADISAQAAKLAAFSFENLTLATDGAAPLSHTPQLMAPLPGKVCATGEFVEDDTAHVQPPMRRWCSGHDLRSSLKI